MARFMTRFNYIPMVPPPNNGPSKVDGRGYLSIQEQVFRYQQAGSRLEAYREGDFEYGPDVDVDDAVLDPTRAPGFEMSDLEGFDPMAVITEANRQLEEAQAKQAEALAKANESTSESSDGDDAPNDVVR